MKTCKVCGLDRSESIKYESIFCDPSEKYNELINKYGYTVGLRCRECGANWTSADYLAELYAIATETTREKYLEMLGAVPPVEMGESRMPLNKINCYRYFLVGEPTSHIKGVPVYECYFLADDKYYKLDGYLRSLKQ